MSNLSYGDQIIKRGVDALMMLEERSAELTAEQEAAKAALVYLMTGKPSSKIDIGFAHPPRVSTGRVG